MHPNALFQAQLDQPFAAAQAPTPPMVGRATVPEAALREATLDPISATEFVLHIPPNAAYPEGLELHIKHRGGSGSAARTHWFQIERRVPEAPVPAAQEPPSSSGDGGATEVRRPAVFVQEPASAMSIEPMASVISLAPLAPLHSEQLPPTRPTARVPATRPALATPPALPRRGLFTAVAYGAPTCGPDNDDTGPLYPLLPTPAQNKPPAFYR